MDGLCFGKGISPYTVIHSCTFVSQVKTSGLPLQSIQSWASGVCGSAV